LVLRGEVHQRKGSPSLPRPKIIDEGIFLFGTCNIGNVGYSAFTTASILRVATTLAPGGAFATHFRPCRVTALVVLTVLSEASPTPSGGGSAVGRGRAGRAGREGRVETSPGGSSARCRRSRTSTASSTARWRSSASRPSWRRSAGDASRARASPRGSRGVRVVSHDRFARLLLNSSSVSDPLSDP